MLFGKPQLLELSDESLESIYRKLQRTEFVHDPSKKIAILVISGDALVKRPVRLQLSPFNNPEPFEKSSATVTFMSSLNEVIEECAKAGQRRNEFETNKETTNYEFAKSLEQRSSRAFRKSLERAPPKESKLGMWNQRMGRNFGNVVKDRHNWKRF